VLYTLYEMMSWLQPEAAAGGGGGGGAQGGSSSGGGCDPTMQIGMLVVMLLIFYFMLIRPQQKRQREHDDMLKSLRKGVKVRTTGGIRGEIVEINDREAILLIADKVKINVLRSHIAGAEAETLKSDESAKDKDKDDKDAKDGKDAAAKEKAG
jgi:preprotein translocase subunit YajC